jgi:hypothetical protein
MTAITTKGIVAALKKVPEKKFRIAELAPELLDKNGKVDIAKAVDRLPEINLAVVEVQSYVKMVKIMADGLVHINGTPHPGVNALFEEDAADEEDEE